MSERWQDRVAREVVVAGEPPPRPRWSTKGVPYCSENDCPLYDGKRCYALGHRPDMLCEPVVAEMAEQLTRNNP